MTFEITILGCGAAVPTGKHNPTAQVVNLHDKLFLIDCGEGTQMQLRKFKIRFQRINQVFISHLHGDHYLGLMGFISSMHLLGRKTPLTIFGPPDLKMIVEVQLKASQTFLEYKIEFVATTDKEKTLIFEDKSLLVYSFPLKHRIECCGFLFEEKVRKPKIKREFVAMYNLQPGQIIELKRGNNVMLVNGVKLTPAEVCTPADAARSYAFCSDTAPSEKVINAIQSVTMLYHESTFVEEEKARAKSTFHSTAKQAAGVAAKAGVGSLILGHFSSRYTDDFQFKKEALEIFPNVELADEGKTFCVELSK